MTAPTATPPVAHGTIQIWSDLLCPFAYIGVLRLRRARHRLGLDGAVRIEHRTFPLELFNGPHSRHATDAEAVALGQAEPEARLRAWSAPDDRYPHTVLLSAEAVHAASAQGLAAGEGLDLALRRAFWTHSRSITHRQVILDVAGELPAGTVDVTALAEALDSGRHRAVVMADFAVARTGSIPGSPTFRLPDGSAVTNPGMQVRWEGPASAPVPVVDTDDPSVHDAIVRRTVLAAGR